jgi:GT2 family glycosyltransferase
VRYHIAEIELGDPLPALTLDESIAGFALVVRHHGRPVGFVMQERRGPAVVPAAEVVALVAHEVGMQVVADAIHEEIRPAAATPLPSLAIAVCTHDRPALLRRCLASLVALADGRGPIELLVVDNAPSNDETWKLVAASPGVRYVCEPRPGLDFARNRAVAEARGELLAFVDDDVVVDREWLAGLREAFAENPDAGAFTGLVLPLELETRAQVIFEQRGGFRRGFHKRRYHGPTLDGDPLYPCGAGIFGAGCNMVFRRDALQSLGGFDENLDTGAPLPGGGDLDIFYRLVRSGQPLVYEPRMLVFHQHRREYEALRRQYWTWGLGHMAFVAKSHRHDAVRRAHFRRLVLWWLQQHGRILVASLRRRNGVPPDLAVAELTGGIVGLLGEYRRSERRVERIRRRFAA